jgi:hypothetical protein
MQQGYTHTQCSLLQNIKYSFPFITTVNTWIVQICFTRATIVFNHSVPYFIIVQLTSNTVSHFSYTVSDWKC